MVSSRPIRVQIIQPLIPEYRVPFFHRIANYEGLEVKVCASIALPYNNYPFAPSIEEGYVDLNHPCVGLFGNLFLWQRNLKLDESAQKGDVLVVCGNLRFLSNIPLMWQAKRKKIGVVWWGHGFSKRRSRIKDAINRMIMHFVDVRLLYTDKEVEEYRRLGFPANKLFSTNNAIDQKTIREAKVKWNNETLKNFQQNENLVGKNILLFCGRRTNSVCLELVFAALAHLRTINRNNYLFVIIGPDESGGLLGREARRLGVEDCIRWLGPIFDQNDLAPWFLSAGCFVFPGAIGLSLLHAFSYGLPVIVPDCIHGPEIAAFTDGENGFFYKNGNMEDLAQKISSIVDHRDLQAYLSENATSRIETQYNMDAMVGRFVEAVVAAANR